MFHSILGQDDPRRIMEMISVRTVCIEEHFEELIAFFKYKLLVQEVLIKKRNIIKNSSRYLGPIGAVFQDLNHVEKDTSFDLKELESQVMQCKKDIENQLKEIKKTEAIFIKLWKKLPEDKLMVDEILKKNEMQQDLDKKQRKTLLLWDEWSKNVKRSLELLQSIESKRCSVLRDVLLRYCSIVKNQTSPIFEIINKDMALLEEYTFQQDIDQFVNLDREVFGRYN
eukprot:NODE_729_length_4743_cov_0.421619.p3 type:complete len:226 gc:universal NODE_729_length_4743_cov_0.421619:2896-3573(+)